MFQLYTINMKIEKLISHAIFPFAIESYFLHFHIK